jgi:hypothetical protein
MKKLLLAVLVLIGLQTQAQINWCDSISYTTFPQQTLTVVGNASGLSNMLDSIGWLWGVCGGGICYSGTGQTATFPNISSTDTIKVCYDVFIYSFDTVVCTYCDSLFYNQTWGLWLTWTTNITSVNELTLEKINDGKIYDLLGRELNEIPIGTMYIRNNKLYITR